MSFLGGDRDGRIICAVSTPAGVGGISVIRVSGPGAFELIKRTSPNLPDAPISHTIHLGYFFSKDQPEPVDQCLFSFFAKGKSFTGEETVEISCHGSPTLCDLILQGLIQQGATAALPGEFTYRAFMNNKLDLIQAESVLSLIESRSKQSANLALRQLMGGMSKVLAEIESELTWCLAHIEASIDFSTEGLETTSADDLLKKLEHGLKEIKTLLGSYQKGRMIRDGVQIAIVGRPNVGKSSLLNLLLGYERSIVTDIAGTTRDVVSDEVVYQGQRLCFLDTAGIRKGTSDRVEIIGIQRSLETAKGADLVLFIFDASLGFTSEDQELLEKIRETRTIFIGNKIDLTKSDDLPMQTLKIIQNHTAQASTNVLFCSTFDTTHQSIILSSILKIVIGEIQTTGGVLVSNSRHFEALGFAANNLERSIESLKTGVGAELVSLDLKEALMSLQMILGKHYDDQIMDRVFKEFCIGK